MMPCNGNCNEQTPVYSSNCSDCGAGTNTNTVDSSCVIYTGAALTCSGGPSNSSVETLLQILDAKLCETTGNYTGYNVYCLTPVSTEKEFVEKISQFVCNLQATYNNFVSVTYVVDQANFQNQINAINGPKGITSCPAVGIVSADNSTVVLNKLSNSVCNLFNQLNVSAADWGQCFTIVGPNPVTIVEGFNVILGQFCQLKAQVEAGGGSTLPTFNNTGTCLASPGANDSLVDTVLKIRSRLCLTPTFNAANLTQSTCVQFSGASSLEDIIDAQNSMMDALSSGSIRAASSDFVLDPIDGSNLCLGQKISLNTTLVDRKVALDASDVTPSTLDQKFIAGSNISLDFGIANPGKLTISANVPAASADEKVKINSSDPTAGYLIDKLIGAPSTGVLVQVSAASSTQAQVVVTLDFGVIANSVMEAIENDSTLKTRFCTLVSSCPVVCAPPTNGSVTFQ